jgi:DNA-binding NarL/FixJ family response regulator
MPRNVLIIDGHPLVHEVLGSVVRSVMADVKVRAASNIEGAVAILRNDAKLDMVLLDLDLPGCTGIQALTQFRGIFPAVPVIVISADDSRATILAAFRAGAIGYLPKTLTRKVIAGAMQVIAAGGFYVPYEALGDMCNGHAANGNGNAAGSAATAAVKLGLTQRQYEVLQLIQRGYNNRTIARHLEISEGTVKQHVHAMLSTLGVSSRTEAIAAATRLGLRRE